MVIILLSPIIVFRWFVLLSRVLIVVRSNCWSRIWVGLELNLFSFLILMNSNGKFRLEPLIKYFVTQRVGSIIIIIGFIFSSTELISFFYLFILLGVFIKAGFFPFHSWVPMVISQSRYTVSFLILRWQKLGPILMLLIFSHNYILYLSLFFIRFVGSIGGLNQNGVRSILAYSSFVHNSWIICALVRSFYIFIGYFFFYSVSLVFFIYSCKFFGKSKIKNLGISLLGAISLLMLIGVPPFLGFIGKFLVIITFPRFLVTFCILGSIIRLKFYVSFFYRFLVNSKTKYFYSFLGGLFLGLCVFFNLVGALLIFLFVI